MIKVQAGQHVWLKLEYYDRNNDFDPPTSIDYSVRCATTGNLVRASTSVPIGSIVEIELTNSDTVMQDAVTNDEEIRKVCVVSSWGGTDSRTDVFRFLVVEQEAC